MNVYEKKDENGNYQSITEGTPLRVKGVASMENMVKIIPCKCLRRGESTGFMKRALKCIQFARSRGAQVINFSWGGNVSDSGEFSPNKLNMLKLELRDDYQLNNGGTAKPIIAVMAAGNRKRKSDECNKDKDPTYPASFFLPNGISVAATTEGNILWKDSFYGRQSVLIAAPGDNIVSTSSSGDINYRMMSGTSMAAPHVTAAVALMLAKFENSQLTSKEIVDILCDTAIDTLGETIKHGTLNLSNALEGWDGGSQFF